MCNKPHGEIENYYNLDKLPSKIDYSILFHNKNGKKAAIFRLDKPHFENGKPIGYHMNVDTNVPKFLEGRVYDHKEITEEAYLK